MEKKKVLKWFLVFLAFLAVCTVITKAIYKSGMPRVTVCTPDSRNIVRQINLYGSVSPGQEVGVYTEPNLRVSAVYVQTGNRLKPMEALFAVDMQDLEDQIRKAQADCDYMQAQLKDIAAAKKEQSKEQESEVARLTEDYESMLKERDLQIRDYQLSVDVALLRLTETAGTSGGEPEVSDSVSGSDLAAELMRAEYDRALNALEKAKLQKEEAIRDWERRIEDTGAQKYSELARTVKLQGDLGIAKVGLERLKALQEQQGVVYAPEECQVLSCTVRVGGKTTDGACLIYATVKDSGEITAATQENIATMLYRGDSVQIENNKKKYQGVVTYIEAKDGQTAVRVAPQEEIDLAPGQTVMIRKAYQSEQYDCVVKKNALKELTPDSYIVYIVEEYEGILGTEDKVRKVSVALMEENETYAAISGAEINAKSRIVLSTDKELHEGDVVRILDD